MKKFLSVLLTLALVANLTAIVFVNAVATESQQTKVFNFLDSYTAEELAELTADPDDYYVSVFVEFAYPEMDTAALKDLPRDLRNDTIMNYHYPKNLEIAIDLGIDTNTISYGSPYAELSYNTVDEFENNRDYIYDLADSEDIRDINISLIILKDQSVRADNSEILYPLSDIYEDIGFVDNEYDGDGVKVGIVELSVPQYQNHITDDKLIYPGKDSNSGEVLNLGSSDLFHIAHVDVVTYLLGGSNGIAEDVTFYVSPLSTTVRACVEWLVYTHNVDIVNMSCGWDSFAGYDNMAAYFDYIIDLTGCSFVISAGNTGKYLLDNYIEDGIEKNTENDIYTNYFTSPASSANCITVGASRVDGKVHYFSSFYNPTPLINKPDLVAPGGDFDFLPYYLVDSEGNALPWSGTSFSAPIVTGISARLIDEFPVLGANPNLLKAVLLASCTPAHDQIVQHDQYAGAGIVNYSRARQIMIDGTYGMIQKYTDMSDNEYWGSIEIETTPGNLFDFHYAIQVPARSLPAQNLNSAYCVFSEFDLTPVNSNNANQYIRNATIQNSGAIEFPSYDGTVSSYIIEIYLNENCCPTKDEYLAYAYMTYPVP